MPILKINWKKDVWKNTIEQKDKIGIHILKIKKIIAVIQFLEEFW